MTTEARSVRSNRRKAQRTKELRTWASFHREMQILVVVDDRMEDRMED